MKVLSLFDGIACGHIALDRVGIPVERYVAYEIEPSAMKIALHNYPDIEERGDVFKADFTEFKDFDLLIGGSPCFTKGHLVLTNTGYKPIEDIEIGDLVYTHMDRFRRVTAVGHKIAKNVHTLYAHGCDPFTVTLNHPFYVASKITPKNKPAHFTRPYWAIVQDLSNNDYLSSPIMAEINPIELTTAKSRQLKAAASSLTMREIGIPMSVLLSSRRVCKAFLKAVLAEYRRLHDDAVPGCIKTDDRIHAYTLALLIQKAYRVNCDIEAVKKTRKCGKGKSGFAFVYNQWVLTWDNKLSKDSVGKLIDGKLFTPVKRKKLVGEEIVYNISVDEDESYVVNNRIVHNCTNWSIAKAGHGRETTNSGIGWELFNQYVRAWKESGVKYYLYENNASMSKEIRKAISDTFGHEPLEINSALVSAQTRKRLYWTNIPGACVPEDRGIILSSILEHGFVDRDKSLCLARRYAGFQGTLAYLCRRYFGKSMGQAAFEGGDISNLKELYKSNDRFTDEEGLATGCTIRPLTIKECERLQTLPDGYTESSGCSRIQCIEAIGNGWTVNVITHLMSGLKDADMSPTADTAEPGLRYIESNMACVGNVLPDEIEGVTKCADCGKPIKPGMANLLIDSGEHIRLVCDDCVARFKRKAQINHILDVAGVKSVAELKKWLDEV